MGHVDADPEIGEPAHQDDTSPVADHCSNGGCAEEGGQHHPPSSHALRKSSLGGSGVIRRRQRSHSCDTRSRTSEDLQAPLMVKVPIVGFETMEERAKFTIFKLRVENDLAEESWLVFRRYTDFVRLHSKLKEEIPECEIAIPPKRWLRDNFDTVFLEDRMKGLQAFIDSLLLQPKLVCLPIVRKFFCLDEPPVYSDTAEETRSWVGIVEDSAVMLRHKLNEKEREMEVLRTEVALLTTQKENLLKTLRSCSNCREKKYVGSTSCNSSTFTVHNNTPISTSSVPSSSGSSSEHGSPLRQRPIVPLRAKRQSQPVRDQKKEEPTSSNSASNDQSIDVNNPLV